MSVAEAEYAGEKCVRCGEVGDDRRNLYMACLYDMSELGIPFEQLQIRGTVHEKTGDREVRFGPEVPEAEKHRYPVHRIPVYEEKPKYDKPNDYPFFKMRVCKGCRSDWMAAIKNWFLTPAEERSGCGSGIWIRERGALREITQEEWDRRYAESRR